MSLFQNITGAIARDCIVDEKMDRVIFVVNKGQMGLAIGKGGATIRQLQGIVTKKVELVEYSEAGAKPLPRESITTEKWKSSNSCCNIF